jgi:hypothetical protein
MTSINENDGQTQTAIDRDPGEFLPKIAPSGSAPTCAGELTESSSLATESSVASKTATAIGIIISSTRSIRSLTSKNSGAG